MGNRMKEGKFLGAHLYGGLLALAVYRAWFFEPLPGVSKMASGVLLWGLVWGLTLLGMAMTCRRRRNWGSVTANVLMPFVFYTIVSVEDAALWVGAGAAGVGLVWFFWVLWSNRRRKKKAAVVRHGFLGGRAVFAWVFALCWIPLWLWGPAKPAAPEPVRETKAVLQEQRRELAPQLGVFSWQEMEGQKRLEVLQRVADLEAGFLGLPHGVTVVAKELEETTAGAYIDSTRTIYIDRSYLEAGQPISLVQTVCHEVYHAYQFRLCDLWRSVGEEYRNLQCFSDAARMEAEFADYVSGKEDFETYYNQVCETTARDYARGAAEEYYTFVLRLQSRGIG